MTEPKLLWINNFVLFSDLEIGSEFIVPRRDKIIFVKRVNTALW